MPDTVTADEVLNDVFEEIKEGAKESRCKISQDAEAMYRRRYRSSVQAKLDANDPGDWKNLHKQHVIKVGRAHGKIAGVICRFHLDMETPGATDEVTTMTLAKAGHMMELECQAYLQLVQTQPKERATDRNLARRGGYCW